MISMIEHLLLNWYRQNKRDLPWRKTTDPYAIWVSEIMLQQTQVETVIPYYERFMENFPEVGRLADAQEEEVLSLWKGLGYYSRARNLHKAAQVIRDQYQHKLPDSYQEIRKLPGVGDYTAGAIASIAYNQAYPAVDGNVLRVIARLYAIAEDISQPKVKKKITELVSKLIPTQEAGDFTQAVMELGATVCVPKNPQCSACPLISVCEAYRSGLESTLPLKKKAKTAVELDYTVAVIYQNDSILMEHRNNTRLLGNMWGLPLTKKEPPITAEKQFFTEWGLPLKRIRSLGLVQHTFSHQIWKMDVIMFSMDERTVLRPGLAWITPQKLAVLPIPKVFQKVFKRIEDLQSY